MKSNCSIYNNRGMILIEALISLMVISLMMHGIYQIMNSYQRVRFAQSQELSADGHQFLSLLEAELRQYQVEEVKHNTIKMKNEAGNYQVVLENNKIYKKPGHHPYAYQVQSWELNQKGSWIEVMVTYQSQQKFFGIVKYEE